MFLPVDRLAQTEWKMAEARRDPLPRVAEIHQRRRQVPGREGAFSLEGPQDGAVQLAAVHAGIHSLMYLGMLLWYVCTGH